MKVEEKTRKIVWEIAFGSMSSSGESPPYKSPSDIPLDAELYRDLDIDSLDSVEVILSIEEEFDISIKDKTISTDKERGLLSLQSLIKLVQEEVSNHGRKL